jgi:hypothetical protein
MPEVTTDGHTARRCATRDTDGAATCKAPFTDPVNGALI